MYSQNGTIQQVRSQNSLLLGLVQSLENQIAAKNKETEALRAHIKCKSPDYHLLLSLLEAIEASQPPHSHDNLTQQVNCVLEQWGKMQKIKQKQDAMVPYIHSPISILQEELVQLKADNSCLAQVIAQKDACIESSCLAEREMADKMKEKENIISTQEALIFGLEQQQKGDKERVDELEMILTSKTQSIQELSQFLNSTNEKVSSLERQVEEYPGILGDLRVIIASKEQSVLELTEFVESLMKKQATEQTQLPPAHLSLPCENCLRLTQDLESLRQMHGDMLLLMNNPPPTEQTEHHSKQNITQHHSRQFQAQSSPTLEMQTQTEETIKQLENLAQQNSDLKDLLSNIMITNHNKSFEEDKTSKIEQEISEQISLQRGKFNQENQRLAEINHNLQIELKKMETVIDTYEEQLKEAEEKLNVMSQVIMEVNQKEERESQQEGKLENEGKDQIIETLTNALEMLTQHQEESNKKYEDRTASLQTKHNEAVAHLESEHRKLASSHESLSSAHDSLLAEHESLGLKYQKVESQCRNHQNETASLKRQYQQIHELIELYQAEIERYKEELTEAEKKCVNMSELIIEITHKGQSRQSVQNGIDQAEKQSQDNIYRHSIGHFMKPPLSNKANEGDNEIYRVRGNQELNQKVKINLSGPNEVFIRPNEVFIRPDEVFIRPNEVSTRPISQDRPPSSSNPAQTISFNNGAFRFDQQLQFLRKHYDDSTRSIAVLAHHLDALTEEYNENESAFHRDILALQRVNAQLNTLILQLNRKLYNANPDENIQTFLQQRRITPNANSIHAHDESLGGRKAKRQNESYVNMGATYQSKRTVQLRSGFNNGLSPVGRSEKKIDK